MQFETKALGPIGVEIVDVTLRADLPDTVFEGLRSLVVDVGLVLFRNAALDPSEHIALGKRFGPLENLDPARDGGASGMVVIGNVDGEGRVLPNDNPFMKLIAINEGWHTDSSFRAIPASFSLFSAVVVPERGGDTFYASLTRGWESLPEDERTRLYELRAVHDYATAYRARGSTTGNIVGFDSEPVTHPLVRRHPESGRAGLYVSEHVSHVEGLPSAESDALLAKLLAAATHPDNIYRHRWEPGDFMIWDNRSMLHRAQGFDGKQARVMHHVRVAGSEAPIAAEA